MLPFNQALKRKVVIRRHVSDQSLCRVYVQGAPEEIIKLCNFTLNEREEPQPFGQDDKNLLLGTVSEMAASSEKQPGDSEFSAGLKVFSYAFKDMPY